jgi:hypothetical protein
MSNRTLRALVAGLALLVLPSVAAAQTQMTNEEFNLTATMPAGWEVVEGNERAVFNFKETGAFSQLEIIGTTLLTPEAATVFFDTFHRTLTEQEFAQTGAQDTTYGTLAGKETVYTFTHDNVTLKVVVFQFVRENTAWLTVGYMQESVFDQQLPTFQAVVQTLSFGTP